MGSGRPRERKIHATADTMQIIENENARAPADPVYLVAERAITRGEEAGINMPSHRTVGRLVERLRGGRVPPTSAAAGADIVVATCAIDLPVLNGATPEITMPIATFAIHATATPATLGLALSMKADDMHASARSLQEAFSGRSAIAAGSVIALHVGDQARWSPLTGMLMGAGFDVRAMAPAPPTTTNDAVILLGRRPGGFRLMPGMTRRPPGGRIPTIPVGASPLSMEEAETLLRQRLIDGRHAPNDQSGPVRDAELQRGLGALATSAG